MGKQSNSPHIRVLITVDIELADELVKEFEQEGLEVEVK